MNKLKVEMHNNSFFWYKVFLYIIKKNRLILFSEIKPVSFNLYITTLSHHHIITSPHHHIITSSHHFSFSFAKYIANERYKKCVHFPKGTMINAH